MFLKHLAVSNYLLDTGVDRPWTPLGHRQAVRECPVAVQAVSTPVSSCFLDTLSN
jgi:hypothetical protein